MIPLLPGPEFLPHLPELLADNQEFAALRSITPDVVAQVCRLGYMPMGLGEAKPDTLLVKCHQWRMVLDLEDMHVPGNVRRYARGLTVSVDHQFSAILTEIDRYHADSWISPPLAEAFLALHERPIDGVRLHSVEVHDPAASADAPPVAAEIGYSVGAVYSSLSGYHTRNGSGWVQMVSLGRLLRARSATFWDLGMDIPYKRRLGARPVVRQEFLKRYQAAAATCATAAATSAAVVGPARNTEPLLQPAGPLPAYEFVIRPPVSHDR